jgi:hypothetical protein
MLLESGEAPAALAAYEASQTRDPRRFRSLSGAAQAAVRSGDGDKARRYYAQLIKITGEADSRPELAVARDYLAAH